MIAYALISSFTDIVRSLRSSLEIYKARREMHAKRKREGIADLVWETTSKGELNSEPQK